MNWRQAFDTSYVNVTEVRQPRGDALSFEIEAVSKYGFKLEVKNKSVGGSGKRAWITIWGVDGKEVLSNPVQKYFNWGSDGYFIREWFTRTGTAITPKDILNKFVQFGFGK